MRVGQPGMQGGKADLGAVAEQQKDEGDVEQSRVEAGGMLDQHGPHHGVRALADHWLCGHVDENGAEEGERNANASQNEIFPGGFQRFMSAIDADHEHGGQRGKLHRHPHQTDVVRHERQVHAEHHDLVHGVVEPQVRCGQPAGVQLVRNVGGTEHTGGEADECVEHDENDVEIVDQQILPRLRPVGDKKRQRGKQGQEAGDDIQACRHPIVR
jgi:hypothetical protein